MSTEERQTFQSTAEGLEITIEIAIERSTGPITEEDVKKAVLRQLIRAFGAWGGLDGLFKVLPEDQSPRPPSPDVRAARGRSFTRRPVV